MEVTLRFQSIFSAISGQFKSKSMELNFRAFPGRFQSGFRALHLQGSFRAVEFIPLFGFQSIFRSISEHLRAVSEHLRAISERFQGNLAAIKWNQLLVFSAFTGQFQSS